MRRSEAELAAPTVSELLRRRATATPDAECLRFEGNSLTFAEVAERAVRLAAVLHERGVRPGDRVAVMLPNGLDFPIAWLAIPLLRATVVPVHVGYRGRDLTHVLQHSQACYALVGPQQFEAVVEVAASTPGIEEVRVLGAEADSPVSLDADLRAATPLAAVAAGQESDDPLAIQYTSGTTGLPRGCVLDHRYWLGLARTMQRYARLAPGDVALTAQLQSYMDPSWNLVLCLLAGVPLVVLPRFSASRFWRAVRENGATFFYCIGTMPLYLFRQPADPGTDRAHRVRLVYCSGIPPALHAAFEARWGCVWRETYGTTELGAVLVAPPEDVESVGSGSMGAPVPGREVRLVDEHGDEVPEGEPGELLVRGRGLMQGYYRDPEATAEWRVDGWARTGDLVVRDAPDRYRLIGRIRDVIRRAGENVSAAEVEAVLMEHPAVRAAACVPVPDELRGEEIKAYVQLAPGYHPETVQAEALREFVAARLARFKVPRYLEFVALFPLTPSEKIAKAELLRSRVDHRVGAWDGELGTWRTEQMSGTKS